MSDAKRNIVIVGGSFGALGFAHHLLRKHYPALNSSSHYQLIIVSPNDHFFYRPGAPRMMGIPASLPHSIGFEPIARDFEPYGVDTVQFRQAFATALDTTARTLTLQPTTNASKSDTPPSGPSETLPYHALIIATGSQTPSPTTSLCGPHTLTQDALDKFDARLKTPGIEHIVVAGGGPVGVETASELGARLNGTAGLKGRKVRITLLAGGQKLLPILRQSLSEKAEKYLNRVGVDVVYGKKVTAVQLGANDADLAEILSHDTRVSAPKVSRAPEQTAQSTVTLADGEKLTCDIYLPATGSTPNTAWLPSALLTGAKTHEGYEDTDKRTGYVRVNEKTLRVEDAGPRVYAVGDVASVSRGGLMEMMAQVPAVAANLVKDLTEGKQADKEFTKDEGETQFVPVGPWKGVAAYNGWSLPSVAVHLIKGRDYMSAFRKMYQKW